MSGYPDPTRQYGLIFKDLHNLGWSHEAIAAKFQRSSVFVTALLELQEMPMVVQHLVGTGVISRFFAVKIFRENDGNPERLIAALRSLRPDVAVMMDQLTRPTVQRSLCVSIYLEDCLQMLARQRRHGLLYDAIITDPPYEIKMHGKPWDHTGISFSPPLWEALLAVLKPGGFIAAFGATRMYHRLAAAAEAVGMTIYPFLAWKFNNGIPKPANVSELFDRVNLSEREFLGFREGSGYTRANATQGLQNRHTTQFPIYARHVSAEAKKWRGWYYGLTCMRPNNQPILLAQKPIDQPRTIDNLRVWGTGALNLGALHRRHGTWPSLDLEHNRQRGAHGSEHPSVKPISLMEDLCLLLCPPGGVVLDPFAGTGTTAIAAQRCGFGCTLIEDDPSLRAVIERRLRAHSIDFEIHDQEYGAEETP